MDKTSSDHIHLALFFFFFSFIASSANCFGFMHRLMHHSRCLLQGRAESQEASRVLWCCFSVAACWSGRLKKKQKHSFSTRQKWINSYLGVSRGSFSCFLDLSHSLIHCKQPIEAKPEGDWVKLLCVTLNRTKFGRERSMLAVCYDHLITWWPAAMCHGI